MELKGFRLLLIGAITCVLWASCGSVPPTYYYRIDYDVDSAAADGSVIPATLGVAIFGADELYQGDRIIYRHSDYEVQYYHYRRWVTAPRKMVTEKVVDHMQESNLFQEVVRMPTTTEVDYILRGQITAFEEWNQGDQWFGQVGLEMWLQDVKTSELIWEGELSRRTAAARKDPVAVVEAISIGLKQITNEALLELRTKLTVANN